LLHCVKYVLRWHLTVLTFDNKMEDFWSKLFYPTERLVIRKANSSQVRNDARKA